MSYLPQAGECVPGVSVGVAVLRCSHVLQDSHAPFQALLSCLRLSRESYLSSLFVHYKMLRLLRAYFPMPAF